MKIIKEFKQFAMKGNAIELAVAVMVGTAFNKIVTSLVNDILMPPIGILIGKVDFVDLEWVIREAENGAKLSIKYGAFLQTVFDFLIIALTIFVVMKLYNKMVRKEEKKAAAKPSKEVELLTEIRDALVKKEERKG